MDASFASERCRPRHDGVSRARFDVWMRAPIVPRMIALDTDRLTASLPKGYRARPFEERDREPWIAERNTWYGPMEQGSAEEGRICEEMRPDGSILRLVVVGATRSVAGMANGGHG